MNFISKQKYALPIAAGVLWLFHISGIIGVSLGYKDWFASRTSLNLIILGLILIVFFPVQNLKTWIVFLVLAGLGILVEYLGVNYGLFFGDYAYGENMGPKIGGVPWLIGLNWALLTFITGAMANYLTDNWFFKSLIGTFLMLFLDILMEASAPIFDFWEFSGGYAPIDNYIAWGIVAFLFHLIFSSLKLKGNLFISLHMYFVQLVFFIYFYVYF
jgi:putative membrane protein